jgi:DNA polymerase III delta prime subunit
MYENIIGQRQVVERLSQEYRANQLPPVLLFHGPDYSGKCSTALELARILTCTSGDPEVPWKCACRSCTMQKHLIHPNTLLLGGRYFNREIAVAATALKRDRRRSIRFLLERSVRKLVRRFDSVVWQRDEQRSKNVEPLLDKLEELLSPYLPDAELPPEENFASGIDALVEVCEELASTVNLDTVPVDRIRALSAWARTSGGRHKVAIIENIDRLQESARNALLKTLEEPSRGVTFVLTTTHRAAVISTILSRARTYGFLSRGVNESREVITRVYHDDPGDNASIRDYLGSVDGRGLRPLAERYIEVCIANGDLELGLLDEIDQTVQAMGGAEGFRYFVEELTDLLHGVLRSAVLPLRTVTAWRDLVHSTARRVEAYHVQPKIALEGLYYAMRQAA